MEGILVLKNDEKSVKVLRPYKDPSKVLQFNGEGSTQELHLRFRNEIKEEVAKNPEKWIKEHGCSVVNAEAKVEEMKSETPSSAPASAPKASAPAPKSGKKA